MLRNANTMNEETMFYDIAKKYREHPNYRDLMHLIEHGLMKGWETEFEYIRAGSHFMTKDGDIYQKLHEHHTDWKRYGSNARTFGVNGLSYRRFLCETKVKEFIPVTARPAGKKRPSYTESNFNLNFPYEKALLCHKVDREFCEVPDGEYFAPRRLEGIWKKIPKTFKKGRNYNAITRANRIGLRFAWFTKDDPVKQFVEDKNHMNPEDVLAEIGLVDKDLDLNIQVKPQAPEHEVVATVPVTCTKFRADYTSEDDEIVCAYSMDLKIGDHVAHISEKEKVEIEVKGEMLVIIPVKRLANRHGFIAQVTGGSADPLEVPIYLGSGLGIQVTKLA